MPFGEIGYLKNYLTNLAGTYYGKQCGYTYGRPYA